MTETAVQTSLGRMTGLIKWFNTKSGFGFITVLSQNEYKGNDIFVHYSAIRSSKTQYKYLVQGEYVDFDLTPSENSDHKFVARDVTGVLDGPIMCETRAVAIQQHPPSPERTYKMREPSDGFTNVQGRSTSGKTSRQSTRQSTEPKTSSTATSTDV
jgi:cold shock CspA family protein